MDVLQLGRGRGKTFLLIQAAIDLLAETDEREILILVPDWQQGKMLDELRRAGLDGIRVGCVSWGERLRGLGPVTLIDNIDMTQEGIYEQALRGLDVRLVTATPDHLRLVEWPAEDQLWV